MYNDERQRVGTIGSNARVGKTHRNPSYVTTLENNLMKYKTFVGVIAISVGVLAAPPTFADLSDGLVAHYEFEGNTDDSSGNEHHGVPDTELPGFVEGHIGLAGDFNGKDAALRVTPTSLLQPTHSVTVSAWIKMRSIPKDWSHNKIVSSSRSPAPYGGYWLDIVPQAGQQHGLLQARFVANTNTHEGVIGATKLKLNQWHHVVGMYDGKTRYIFLDGKLDGTTPAGTSIYYQSNSQFWLGKWHDGIFDGQIDDARIYNRALSECEIQSLYTGEDECGVCVLDFAEVDPPISYDGYPGYFNEDGFHVHTVKEAWEPVVIDRFLSCYERKSRQACEATVVTTKHIWYPVPDGQDAEVTSAHWFEEAESCAQLRRMGILPREVKLLATGVNLTATVNGNGVDLTLTTSAEPDTAALSILRGEKLENGGTKINVVCEFHSGGSPYTCTDTVVGDNYRVLETEYDGDLIVYDEVTPK